MHPRRDDRLLLVHVQDSQHRRRQPQLRPQHNQQLRGQDCPTGTSKHAVRCCSDTAVAGWSKKNGCSVWGASPGCADDKTYAEASAHCTAAGGRLCTHDELEADCTAGTGCSFDSKDIWSAEAKCVVSHTDVGTTIHGYKTVKPGRADIAGKESCSDPQASGATMSVRCCSDTSQAGWVKKNSCSVWGGSDDMDGTCHTGKTHAEAEAICAAANSRLCTAAELEGDCTRGSGCGFDSQGVWSSTSCTA